MIYVAQTHIMNGTVTAGISSMGIEADTFEEAKAILKDKVEAIAELDETETAISFEIPQPEPGPFKAYVNMYDKPLEIFRAPESKSSKSEPECEGCPNEGECSHKQPEG